MVPAKVPGASGGGGGGGGGEGSGDGTGEVSADGEGEGVAGADAELRGDGAALLEPPLPHSANPAQTMSHRTARPGASTACDLTIDSA